MALKTTQLVIVCGIAGIATFGFVVLAVSGADILQLLLVVASSFLALATTMSWLSSRELNRTIIRPRIFVRGSTRQEREEAALRGQIDQNQVVMPGIYLENIGLGPAIRGDITLIQESGPPIPIREGDQHSFHRIPRGWVYMYPSHSSPELARHLQAEGGGYKTELKLKMTYYDLQDTKYELKEDEQRIVFPRPGEAVPPVAVNYEFLRRLLDILGGLDADTMRRFLETLTPERIRRALEFLSGLQLP